MEVCRVFPFLGFYSNHVPASHVNMVFIYFFTLAPFLSWPSLFCECKCGASLAVGMWCCIISQRAVSGRCAVRVFGFRVQAANVQRHQAVDQNQASGHLLLKEIIFINYFCGIYMKYFCITSCQWPLSPGGSSIGNR